MEKQKNNQIDKYGLSCKVVNAVKKIKQNKEIGNEEGCSQIGPLREDDI